MRIKRALIGLAAASALLAGTTVLPADAAPKPRSYKNCTALNKVYKHGVGKKKGVKDKVRGKTKPVTKFTINGKVYSLNKKLDRDKDGIACEKR